MIALIALLFIAWRALVNPPKPIEKPAAKRSAGAKRSTAKESSTTQKQAQRKKKPERRISIPAAVPNIPSGWIVVRYSDSKVWRGTAYGTGRNFTSDPANWHVFKTEQDAYDAVDWAEFKIRVDVFEL